MNLSLNSQKANRRVAASASLVSVILNGLPNMDGRATDTVLFGCLYPGIRLRWIGFGGCFIVSPVYFFISTVIISLLSSSCNFFIVFYSILMYKQTL